MCASVVQTNMANILTSVSVCMLVLVSNKIQKLSKILHNFTAKQMICGGSKRFWLDIILVMAKTKEASILLWIFVIRMHESHSAKDQPPLESNDNAYIILEGLFSGEFR